MNSVSLLGEILTGPFLLETSSEATTSMLGRRQQLGEGWFETLADVPHQAISMSIKQIMRARTIICTVPDRRKAQAVHDCFTGFGGREQVLKALADLFGHADVHVLFYLPEEMPEFLSHH